MIPILEELFWRGWLMRWLIDKEFLKVPLGMYVSSSFWLVALLFASEHGPYWEVGLIAGAIYNWWIVRTRNLAAQEGDRRFREVRNEALRPLREGLAAKVAEAQRTSKVPAELSPIAAASALSAMLERMAAFHADLEVYGASRADVVETTARIIYQTCTGRTA